MYSMMRYHIAMTVLQYLNFSNFTREFLNLFCAGWEGQGKDGRAEARSSVLLSLPKGSREVYNYTTNLFLAVKKCIFHNVFNAAVVQR